MDAGAEALMVTFFVGQRIETLEIINNRRYVSSKSGWYLQVELCHSMNRELVLRPIGNRRSPCLYLLLRLLARLLGSKTEFGICLFR
jgi:hypothetical protein